MSRNFLLASLLLSLVVFSGCASKTTVPPKQVPEVVLDTVVQRDVQHYIDTTGHADAFEYVRIPARVSGFLREMRYKAGDLVVVDAPLFLIEPDQYKASVDAAEADLASRKAQLLLAEANLTRTKELRTQNALTQADLDSDQAKRDEADAAVKKAEADLATAKLNLSYTDVRSPIAGKVDRNLVDVGNMVGPNGGDNILTTVAGMDPIYIYFDISDTEFNHVREVAKKTLTEEAAQLVARLKELKESRLKRKQGSQASSTPSPQKKEDVENVPFMVGLIKGAAPNTGEYPFKGVIDMASNTIDKSTGTITIRGEIPNETYEIFRGQICRVRIPTFKQPGAILVKEEAIATDLNSKFVYVVDEKNVARRQNVVLGQLESDNMRVVESGLKAGDRYVSVGIQKTRDGGEVKATVPAVEEKKTEAPKPTETPKTEEKKPEEKKAEEK